MKRGSGWQLCALLGAFASCDAGTDGTDAGSGFLITGGGVGSSSSGGGSATGGGGGTNSTGGGTATATGGGTGTTTGGGSGATGGGSAVATGGGTGTSTCRELTAWAASDLVGVGYDPEYEADGWHYDWLQAGYATVVGTSGNGDYLAYEFWSETPTPTLPVSGAVEGPYANCSHCAFVYEDCDATTCGRYYMGQTGTATVSAFSADVDGGSFGVTLSDVTFVEWDTTNDVAVTGGACLHLATQTFNVSW